MQQSYKSAKMWEKSAISKENKGVKNQNLIFLGVETVVDKSSSILFFFGDIHLALHHLKYHDGQVCETVASYQHTHYT